MSTRSFTPDDPALPANYPGFVFRMLRDKGYPPSELLAETGLDETHLQDPDFRCGFRPLRQLILNAIEYSRDPLLGVTLALQFQPTYIGLPAYTAMNAQRFADGLHVLERFLALNFPAFELKLLDKHSGLKAGEAAIRIRSRFPLNGIECFAFSSAHIAINSLLKAMLRTDHVATRAEITVCRPERWHAVKARIGFPFRFDADDNCLFFPDVLLNCQLPGSDPINHARLVALCERCERQTAFATTPVTQIIALFESSPSLNVSLPGTAAALRYSERGLRRQLERSGTSYRQLTDEIRERRARDLLARSMQPIKAIASEVGFKSPSNFARSFKRWTGLTPNEFRKKARAVTRDEDG